MDGTTAEADVVVIANGVKSSVRDALMARTIESTPTKPFKGASYSNTICWRGLVSRGRAEALGADISMWQRSMLLVAKDKVCRTIQMLLVHSSNFVGSMSLFILSTRGKSCVLV